MNIWKRVKDAVTRATPKPADPPHDREVLAWLANAARENDNAMPPTGMRISDAAVAALSASPTQRADVARQLEAISPPTGNAADLLPRSPQGPWG